MQLHTSVCFRRGVFAAAIVGALMWTPLAAHGQVNLRLTDYATKTHPNYLASVEMAKRIEERTKGQVKITLFPESALGTSPEQTEQVRRGAIDLGMASAGQLAPYNPAIGMLAAPYVFDNYEHVWKFFDGPGKPWIEAEFKKAGFHYIAAFEWGFRATTNNKRPINSPDDLKGLKMRVPPELALKAVMEALGATPVTINFQEVYMALSTNTVDGQDNPLATIHTAKFFEVQKHLAVTNHQYTAAILIANPKSWAKLTPEQQTIVTEEARDASERTRRAVVASESDYLNEFRKKGIAVTTPNIAEFRTRMKPAYDQIRTVVGAEAYEAVIEAAEAARK